MNADLEKHSIGWIGLGRMGYAMAERLAMAGANVGGYNRTRAKAEALKEVGITLVDHPVELAGRDIVFTMVSTGNDLKKVLFGTGGLLAEERKGPSILVDCSTVSEEVSAEIRERAARLGTGMLVVPVSGNDVVARAGKLRALASGPEELFNIVRPYLECFGPSVTYIGTGDSSRIVKIAHNLFLGIVFQGLAECLVLAEKHGVPRHVFLRVINDSVLGSTFTRYKTPGIVNLDFTVTFTQALLSKDLGLGLEAAEKCGAQLPLTSTVRDLVQKAIDAGEADKDYTTLFLHMAKAAGLDVQPENVEVSDGLS